MVADFVPDKIETELPSLDNIVVRLDYGTVAAALSIFISIQGQQWLTRFTLSPRLSL